MRTPRKRVVARRHGERRPARPTLHARVVAAVVATSDRERWLCAFANRDLTQTPKVELDDLRWEVQAFTYQRPDMGRAAPELFAAPKPRTLQAGRPAKRSAYFLLDDADAVRGLQGRLQHGLRSLLMDGEWLVPVKGGFGVRRANNGKVVMFGGSDPEVAFHLAVCDLLQSLGPRFFVCPHEGCGKFFVAKGRQFYCSRACSQAVRTARFKAGKPGVLADIKHESYVRGRKRQHGKHIKVARRPRQRGSPQP